MTGTLTDAPVSRPAGEDPAGPPARLDGSHDRPFTTRLLRGNTGDPGWARPALLALLTATAVLYLWGLGASGWANSFYSAAVQAGATSWKAFFFGSSDASNFITVDKTPLALWPMALAARVFGVNSWSILVPQALEGVATVGIVYATVRRRFSPGAGLLAGAVLALTPVAVLMFRFNNPDAMLVLLLALGAYAMVRAQEQAATGWLVLAASCVGLGFLAKMLQAMLVVPAFALVYLIAAPTPVRRRLWQLALAGGALVASAGWWVAIVALIPASSRPYIGGSQHNSVLELTLGYNGFGRLTGQETGSAGTLQWGATGITRLFNAEVGGQIAWLLPAALILLAAGLWATRRAPRTDGTRAAFVLWGGWLLVTGLVFSFMQGIFHAYYTVALAPAIAALVGMGAALLWRRRDEVWASAVLALTVVVTAAWAYALLGRSAQWYPALRVTVLIAGLAAAAGLVAARWLTGRVVAVIAAVAIATGVSGPAAYAVQTASMAHTGAIPAAGPSSGGFPGGGPRGGPGGGPRGGPGGGPRAGRGGNGGGTPPGMGQRNGAAGRTGPGAPGRPPGAGPGGGGGFSGLLNATTPSSDLTALLTKNAGSYTWVAATVGSNNASGYQLATGEPVMAIGGFNGSDAAPTLTRFKEYVTEGKIHYFLPGRTAQANSGSDYAQQITAWVGSSFTALTVGGTTVYDLTAPTSS